MISCLPVIKPLNLETGQNMLLSEKKIPVRQRLIFALDVSSLNDAKAIVNKLGASIGFYKIGLELFMAGGYYDLIDWLIEQGKEVFVDLKFFDVPQTVGKAVKQLHGKPVKFLTVHGNDDILKAACEQKTGIKILAVTVLTSLDKHDMDDLGFKTDVKDLVLSRAKRALAIGCDGVISSGQEVKELRTVLGEKFLVVVPGVRPVENCVIDDQKRTVNVEEVFLDGADYIVVGRPIKNAHSPSVAAEAIQSRIAKLFLTKE